MKTYTITETIFIKYCEENNIKRYIFVQNVMTALYKSQDNCKSAQMLLRLHCQNGVHFSVPH